MDTYSRQQPVANVRTDNTYYKIPDESEAGPSHDFAR